MSVATADMTCGHLQKCFAFFRKKMQNIFANVLECWTHVEDRRWLHVKWNISKTFVQMF